MEDERCRFRQAVQSLPRFLREELLTLSEEEQATAEEIRLRVGQPITVLCSNCERKILDTVIQESDLERIVEIASQASIHQVLPSLRQGYLTVSGGHRLGVCGHVLMSDGNIQYICPLSSLNLRIARERQGVGHRLLGALCQDGTFSSTLILAPPGQGKTTLLRDLVRGLSEGEQCRPHRVSLMDERGEVAAMYGGVPQLDVGRRTDVLEGCTKAEGLLLLLRGMNPQVLAMDEITAPEDVEALQVAAGCGVALLASAHGRDIEDLSRRPLYRSVLEMNIFCKVICIDNHRGARTYRVEDIPCFG